jgi:hypothetical protein
MTTSAIRQKLHSYIDTADIKKVKAIYTMLEDSISEITEWDLAFTDELDSRYSDYKKTGKSISEKDANKRINHILKKGKIA